jgi:uncharacterized membrane protein YccF (DUF307 family)
VKNRPKKTRLVRLTNTLFLIIFQIAHLKFSIEHSYFTFWNILWTILFGWWMAFFYVLCAGLLTITVIGLPYARLCWSLASYFFWPFGKFIIRVRKIHAKYCTPKYIGIIRIFAKIQAEIRAIRNQFLL